MLQLSPCTKKVSKCEPYNYHPISLTPCVCKILEKYLDSIKFLNANQHCFRHKRSCEIQLLATLEDWYNALENKNKSVKKTGQRWVIVLSGIPQGTILGPVLFLIYINGIGTNLISNIRLFADDCILYGNTNPL